MSIILHRKLSGNLQSSTEVKPRINNETISTSVEIDKPSICCIDASQYAVSNLQNKNLFSESKKMIGNSSTRLNDDHWDELKETNGEKDLEAHTKPLGKALSRKEKDPRSFTLPCFIRNMCYKALADLGASKVYALGLLKSRKIDLEARLMGDELRKNKPQDPNFEDLIELNDPNEPIKHRRSQIKVFVPIIDKDKGMNEPIIEDIETQSVWYSVFDTSINTAYPGEWIRRIDFLYSFRTSLNWKSMNVGGEFTNLEILRCWSLEISRRLFNTHPCSYTQHGESTKQNIRGVSHSNSF
ncbi:hypothetical protein Tco_0045333 [Tanacetum coccineum]